ncbi:MAG: hypothetical protein QOI35_3189 [Cryptosporangiaceae bacterium]|nr:hypothetical protein [Cryptosporangiaceae bacterium]
MGVGTGRPRRAAGISRIAGGFIATGSIALAGVALTGVAHADERMTVRLDPLTSNVSSGDRLGYTAFLQCSISPRCQHVTVTFRPPAGAAGPGAVSQPLPVDVESAVAKADKSLVVTYGQIVAGHSSQLSVSWPSANYYTAPGPQTASMSAAVANGKGAPSTDTATVDVAADPNPVLTKTGPASARTGDEVTYSIQATNNPGNPRRPRGALALEDATVTDALPDGTQFLSATPAGYVYNPLARTVTWGPIDTDGLLSGNQFGQVTRFPYAKRFQVKVRITEPSQGTALTNHVRLTANPYGPDNTPIHRDAEATTTVGAGQLGGRFTKYASIGKAIDGQRVSFTLQTANNGSAGATSTATDTIPDGFDPSDVTIYQPGSTGIWTGPGKVTVGYSDGTTSELAWKAQALRIAKVGAEVKKVTAEVDGIGPGVQVRVQLTGRIDARELSDRQGAVENCASFVLDGHGPAIQGDKCATITVVPDLVVAEIAKFADQNPVGPGGTIGWSLLVHNDPAGDQSSPLRPKIVDLLPNELSYLPGSFALAQDQPSACPDATQFDITTVPDSSRGRTALRAYAKDGVEIPAGDTTCEYRFMTAVSLDAVSGSYTGDPQSADYRGNLAALYDTDKPMLSDVTDSIDFDADHDTAEPVAVAAEDFTIVQSSALFVSKEVKGDQDALFLPATDGPPLGTSTVGGTVSYRVKVGNLSEKQLTNVVAYDILPAPDTKGLTSGRYSDPAVSEWRPTLTGPIPAPPGPVTVTYSEKADPCRPELDNTTGHSAPFYCAGNPDPSFKPAGSVTDWSAIRSVRFDFGSRIFASKEVETFTWTMKVPSAKAGGVAFTGGEQTWNKVAAQGDRRESDGSVTPLLATEPTWVIDQVMPSASGGSVLPPPAPGAPALPVTSGALKLGVLGAGAAVLLAGIALVVVGRRRRV